MSRLSYKDDDDRSYGCAGMVLSLVSMSKEGNVASVSIDRSPDAMIEFEHEFYAVPNQGLSAKSVWRHQVNVFNQLLAMTIGNVLSRSLIHKSLEMDSDLRNELFSVVLDEGGDTDLVEAEVRNMFDANFYDLQRFFSRSDVRYVTARVSDFILSRRAMTGYELLSYIENLDNSL